MTDRSTAQSLARVLAAAVAVLAIGLVINYFEPGEGWSVLDFVLVEVLVAGAVFVYELALKRPGTPVSALLSVGVAALGGAAVIVGEVDDAPGLMLIGLGLVATGAWMGIRSVRGAAAPEGPPAM